MEVAGKLHQGVTMERILDGIRDSINNKIERKHLINRQDLHNIKRQYKIDSSIRHKNGLRNEDIAKQPYAHVQTTGM